MARTKAPFSIRVRLTLIDNNKGVELDSLQMHLKVQTTQIATATFQELKGSIVASPMIQKHFKEPPKSGIILTQQFSKR